MRSAFLAAGLTLCSANAISAKSAGSVCNDRFATMYSVWVKPTDKNPVKLNVKVKVTTDLEHGVACELFSLPRPRGFALSNTRLCADVSSKNDFGGKVDVVDKQRNHYPLEHPSASVLRFVWLVRDACTVRQETPKLPAITLGGVAGLAPVSPK